MKAYLSLIPLVGLLTGCMTSDPSSATDPKVRQGRAVFETMQAAVTEASREIEPSVAYIELQTSGSSGTRTITIGGGTFTTGGSGGRNKTYAGLVLDEQGHLLVATALKADTLIRATVWIGDEEYAAHLVKTEKELGLSILKIDTDQALRPIDFNALGTLVPGAWSVSLSPSGESRDFAKTRDIGFCSGVEESQFTTYLLNGSRLMTGAPVMNIDGQLSGVAVTINKALAMTDLADELQELLARVKDEQADTQGEAEEDDQGWLGVLHAPVNQDYARKYSLPRGGTLINHVIRNSPAERAGLQAGDLIVAVNGKELRFSGKKATEYFMKVLRAREGKAFKVTVIRNREQTLLSGTFGKAPEPSALRVKALGVDVRNIDPALVVSDKLSTERGVYVNEIEKGSPAAMGSGGALLSKGDVITGIAGVATPDLDAFSTAMDKIQAEQPSVVLVAYTRGRVTGFAALNLSLGEKK